MRQKLMMPAFLVLVGVVILVVNAIAAIKSDNIRSVGVLLIIVGAISIVWTVVKQRKRPMQ
jgi:uncharacterized membrane protein YqjE